MKQMAKNILADPMTGLYCICRKILANCTSRLTVVSREAKEEVPCDGLSTNAREYIYKNKPC